MIALATALYFKSRARIKCCQFVLGPCRKLNKNAHQGCDDEKQKLDVQPNA